MQVKDKKQEIRAKWIFLNRITHRRLKLFKNEVKLVEMGHRGTQNEIILHMLRSCIIPKYSALHYIHAN